MQGAPKAGPVGPGGQAGAPGPPGAKPAEEKVQTVLISSKEPFKEPNVPRKM